MDTEASSARPTGRAPQTTTVSWLALGSRVYIYIHSEVARDSSGHSGQFARPTRRDRTGKEFACGSQPARRDELRVDGQLPAASGEAAGCGVSACGS